MKNKFLTLLIVLLSNVVSPMLLRSQTSGLYGVPIESSAVEPAWYFIYSGNGKILELSADGTEINTVALPLTANRSGMFWRFEKSGSTYKIFNKSTQGGVASDFSWGEAPSALSITASANKWNIKNGTLFLSAEAEQVQATETASSATDFTFVKVPVCNGEHDYVQIKSNRSTSATFWYYDTNTSKIRWNGTDDVNNDACRFRLVEDGTGYFNLYNKAAENTKLTVGSFSAGNTNSGTTDLFFWNPREDGFSYLNIKDVVNTTTVDYNGDGSCGFFGSRNVSGPNSGLRFTDINIMSVPSKASLYFEAIGNGVYFSSTKNSKKEYLFDLHENEVENSLLTIGNKGVVVSGIPSSELVPSINSGNGFTVCILASNINANGQLIQFLATGNAGVRMVEGKIQGVWGTGLYQNPTANPVIQDDGLHSIVIHYSVNEGMVVYVDGIKAYSNLALKSSTAAITQFTIGSMPDNTSANTGMKIKRIRVYAEKLSEADLNDQMFESTGNETKLEIAIRNATFALAQAPIGNNPGWFSEDNKATLLMAIESAKVYNESEATKDEKDTYAETVLQVAVETFKNSRNQIKLSTEESPVWYFIEGVIPYAKGKVIVASGGTENSNYNFTNKTLSANKLFAFYDAGNGKVSIKNRATRMYISGGAKATATPAAFNANFLGEGGQYSFNVAGSNPIHAQESGSVLVLWAGGLNSGSAWTLDEIESDETNLPVDFSNVTIGQGFTVTGIGNVNHPLMYVNLETEGFVGEATLKGLTVDLSTVSDLSSIKALKVYKMPVGDKVLKVENAQLLTSSSVIQEEMTLMFDTPLVLESGLYKLGIAVDISDEAQEGQTVKIKLVDLIKGDDSQLAVNKAPGSACTIFLTQALLVAPGDYGSVSYRIPAIATAKNGDLVAVTDKRLNHSGDLPSNIDLIVQRSSDNGKTWTVPVVIAGENTNTGFGDALILTERETGKLIVLCVSGAGFFGSTPQNPNKIYQIESDDHGVTWSVPRDITSMIYGANCSNEIAAAWLGGFPASGRMLQLESGRIMTALLIRDPQTNTNNNYVMYSDDKGKTWAPSTSMLVRGGDEAKLVQRNDGKVIISSRQGGGRVWNVSNDTTGILWTQSNQVKRPDLKDPNCNGEIVNYTSTLHGFDKNRMLHSLCYAGSRENVSMLLSYDEGETWTVRKSICPTSSAYSTFTILSDGTIGMYYEDGTHGGTAYEMVYVRFSLDWLTDGADQYKPVVDAISSAKPGNVKVTLENNKVVVHNSTVTPAIFTTSGVELSSNTKLSQGIYLVKVAGQTFKITVK